MAQVCPVCGNKTNKDTAAFCTACGNHFPDQSHALALCGCSRTKKPYAIQFEYQKYAGWDGWVAVKAFAIRLEAAERGGYGHFHVKGKVYSGAPCPFCGATSFIPIHEKLTCWDGVTRPCPCAWCDDQHHPGEPGMNQIDAITDI